MTAGGEGGEGGEAGEGSRARKRARPAAAAQQQPPLSGADAAQQAEYHAAVARHAQVRARDSPCAPHPPGSWSVIWSRILLVQETLILIDTNLPMGATGANGQPVGA